MVSMSHHVSTWARVLLRIFKTLIKKLPNQCGTECGAQHGALTDPGSQGGSTGALLRRGAGRLATATTRVLQHSIFSSDTLRLGGLASCIRFKADCLTALAKKLAVRQEALLSETRQSLALLTRVRAVVETCRTVLACRKCFDAISAFIGLP